MNARLRQNIVRKDDRLTVATITGGGPIKVADLGMKRQTVLAHRTSLQIGRKRQALQQPFSTNHASCRSVTHDVMEETQRGTTPIQASERNVAVVAICPIEVSDEYAKRTLEREDDSAYQAACVPKVYELELVLTPRVMTFFADETEYESQELRPLFHGLRRIGLGTRKRSKILRHQLKQTDILISAAKKEVISLMSKRAAIAKTKLELMDELGNSEDPMQALMSHGSGRSSMKSLLRSLSSISKSKENNTVVSELGPSRRVLDFTIQEAWQAQYLAGEDRDWERRCQAKKRLIQEDLPSQEVCLAAVDAMSAWAVFEELDRAVSNSTEAVTGESPSSSKSSYPQPSNFIKTGRTGCNVEQEDGKHHDRDSLENDEDKRDKTAKTKQNPDLSLDQARGILESLPEAAIGSHTKASVEEELRRCADNAKKFMTSSVFDSARNYFLSFLARFLSFFERWLPAEDFLWQLRWERLARENVRTRVKADEELSGRQFLANSPMRDDHSDISGLGESAEIRTSVNRKHLDDARRQIHRTRNGTTTKGTTDEHGVTRCLKKDNEFMDSDVVHGSGSRVHLDVLEPLLHARLKEACELRLSLQAELAAITQYAFDLAAVHAQRWARAWLVRANGDTLRHMRKRRIFEAVLSACILIQSRIRIYWSQFDFEYRRLLRATRCAIRIQCAQRRWKAKQERQNRCYAVCWTAYYSSAVILQCLTRTRCAIKEVRERTGCVALMMSAAQTGWAATTINAMGRRYLAKQLEHRRRVELDLNQRLLKLAHRYLQNGDLWSFLAAINNDYRRYQAEADETRTREDEYAETFIRKVLEVRDAQHYDAWNRFASVSADLQQPTPNAHNALGAARTVGSSAKGCSVPGPRLRLLLEGLENSLPLGSRLGQVPWKASGQKPEQESTKSYGSTYHSSETQAGEIQSVHDDSHGSDMLTQSEAGSVHRAYNAVTEVTCGIEKFRKRRLDFSRPSGLSVLNDIPLGLNDSPARLLKAAAIRTFVPNSFPQGATSRTAFASYTALPPSLAKTKHELDAHNAVAPWIAAISAAGYREIWELCPPSRLEATIFGLQEYVDANAPSQRKLEGVALSSFARLSPLPAIAFAPTCRALAIELLSIAKAAGGEKFPISGMLRTCERYNDLLKSGDKVCITNGQAVFAARMRSVKKSEVPRYNAQEDPATKMNQTAAYRRIRHLNKQEAATLANVSNHEAPAASPARATTRQRDGGEHPTSFTNDSAERDLTGAQPKSAASHPPESNSPPFENKLENFVSGASLAAAMTIRKQPSAHVAEGVAIDTVEMERLDKKPQNSALPQFNDAPLMTLSKYQELENRFEDYVIEDVQQHGGLDAPVRIFVARVAFLVVETSPHPLGRASFRAFVRNCIAATHDEERDLIAARARAAVDLVEPFVSKLEAADNSKREVADKVGNSIKRARDLAEIELADWGIAPELEDQIRAVLTELEATREHSIFSADTKGSVSSNTTVRRRRRAKGKCSRIQLPFDRRFQRSPFDPIGRPVRHDISVALGAQPPTAPLGEATAKQSFPQLHGDEDKLAPQPLFDASNLTLKKVRTDADTPLAKQLCRSVEAKELAPLYLQPFEVVGGAHRSRRLAARICRRAHSLFRGYESFVTAPQLGRDEVETGNKLKFCQKIDFKTNSPVSQVVTTADKNGQLRRSRDQNSLQVQAKTHTPGAADGDQNQLIEAPTNCECTPPPNLESPRACVGRASVWFSKDSRALPLQTQTGPEQAPPCRMRRNDANVKCPSSDKELVVRKRKRRLRRSSLPRPYLRKRSPDHLARTFVCYTAS